MVVFIRINQLFILLFNRFSLCQKLSAPRSPSWRSKFILNQYKKKLKSEKKSHLNCSKFVPLMTLTVNQLHKDGRSFILINYLMDRMMGKSYEDASITQHDYTGQRHEAEADWLLLSNIWRFSKQLMATWRLLKRLEKNRWQKNKLQSHDWWWADFFLMLWKGQ